MELTEEHSYKEVDRISLRERTKDLCSPHFWREHALGRRGCFDLDQPPACDPSRMHNTLDGPELLVNCADRRAHLVGIRYVGGKWQHFSAKCLQLSKLSDKGAHAIIPGM